MPTHTPISHNLLRYNGKAPRTFPYAALFERGFEKEEIQMTIYIKRNNLFSDRCPLSVYLYTQTAKV